MICKQLPAKLFLNAFDRDQVIFDKLLESESSLEKGPKRSFFDTRCSHAFQKITCRNFCARVVSAAIRSRAVFVLLAPTARGLVSFLSGSYKLLGINSARGDIAENICLPELGLRSCRLKGLCAPKVCWAPVQCFQEYRSRREDDLPGCEIFWAIEVDHGLNLCPSGQPVRGNTNTKEIDASQYQGPLLSVTTFMGVGGRVLHQEPSPGFLPRKTCMKRRFCLGILNNFRDSGMRGMRFASIL